MSNTIKDFDIKVDISEILLVVEGLSIQRATLMMSSSPDRAVMKERLEKIIHDIKQSLPAVVRKIHEETFFSIVERLKVADSFHVTIDPESWRDEGRVKVEISVGEKQSVFVLRDYIVPYESPEIKDLHDFFSHISPLDCKSSYDHLKISPWRKKREDEASAPKM